MTVEPAVAPSAVRVNTADVMSGDPSWRGTPNGDHPVGVSMVVLRFAVTNSTSWSPASTDAGTVTEGAAVFEFADASARNSSDEGPAIATVTCWLVEPSPVSLSVTVSSTV